MRSTRILFVDDEPNIRLTLPQILRSHGYEVGVAGTVAEALAQINSQTFDLLIADLNIGEVGDGFTVVSAMRRTQPDCINFILTGYPAFETALQAIRSQVDDYLVKPAEIESLINSIEWKLQNRQPYRPAPLKRVAAVLAENADQIAKKVLRAMTAHPELRDLQLSDEERVEHLHRYLQVVVGYLEKPPGERAAPEVGPAAEYGRLRCRQGYSIPMVIEDARLIHDAIYQAIEDSLLALDLSRLISDLRRMDDTIEVGLKESLKAYVTEEKETAVALKKKREPARIAKRKRAAS